jgi:hypothetical protein
MWGLRQSTFLTVPVTEIGFVRSYSEENEWCAIAGATDSSTKAAHTAAVLFMGKTPSPATLRPLVSRVNHPTLVIDKRRRLL